MNRLPRSLSRLTRQHLAVRALPLSVRRFSSASTRLFPSRAGGGNPNDGSYPTVYDDFYNILQDPSSSSSGIGGSNLQTAISIISTDDTSFTLSDGLIVQTPIIIVNGQVFMWDAPSLNTSRAAPSGVGWENGWIHVEENDWKNSTVVPDVWKILELIDDRPEILLLGTGNTVVPPPAPVRNYLYSLGIQLDVLSTRNASSTYNLLSEEGRKVAVALLPPKRIPVEKMSPDQLQDLLHGRC